MKKFGIVLIAVLLLVSIIGTISASAITIDGHWYLYERFNKENGKTYRAYTGSNLYCIRKKNDPFQTYDAGSIIIGDTVGTRVEFKNNINHGSEPFSGTDDTNRAVWIRYDTATGSAFFSCTHFYGEPSYAPKGTGSGVFRQKVYLDTSSDKTYVYNFKGSQFYEQSFYFAQLAYTDVTFKPYMRFENTPDTDTKPAELTLTIKSNGNVQVNSTDTGKTVARTVFDDEFNGYPNPDWHQIKYVYDFPNKRVDLYFDGDIISTYTSTASVRCVRKLEATIATSASYVIDDYVTDPHDGRTLTPFFTDFYIDGLKRQNTLAGEATALVKLYKDIPASYVIVGARYDENGRLLDVKLMNESDADTIDNSITVNFGTINATDKLMVTAWDSMGTITPLVASEELVPAA